MNLDQAVVLAFLAGFSERLVGDVLTKAAASAQTGASGVAAVKEAQAASDVSRGANESNPRGNDRSADSAEPGRGSDDPDRQAHEEGHIDGCLCDSDVQPDEVTSDVELPEASGGVESGTRANG